MAGCCCCCCLGGAAVHPAASSASAASHSNSHSHPHRNYKKHPQHYNDDDYSHRKEEEEGEQEGEEQQQDRTLLLQQEGEEEEENSGGGGLGGAAKDKAFFLAFDQDEILSGDGSSSTTSRRSSSQAMPTTLRREGDHFCGTPPLHSTELVKSEALTRRFQQQQQQQKQQSSSSSSEGNDSNNNDDDPRRRRAAAAVATSCKGCIIIDTHIHVITNDDASLGHLSNDTIRNQMQILNAAFAESPFQFALRSTPSYTRNSSLFFLDQSYDYDVPSLQADLGRLLRRRGADDNHDNHHKKTLHIYTLQLRPLALGVATFPSAMEGIKDGVFLDHCTLPPGGNCPPYNTGATAVHEVGHWLGLLHVFEGGCNDERGDYVADTPAQADIVRYSCTTMMTPPSDSCPDLPGVDPVDNYMGYSIGSCDASSSSSSSSSSSPGGRFTPGQWERMYDQWYIYRDGSGGCDADGEGILSVEIKLDSRPGDNLWRLYHADDGQLITLANFGDSEKGSTWHVEICLPYETPMYFGLGDKMMDGLARDPSAYCRIYFDGKPLKDDRTFEAWAGATFTMVHDKKGCPVAAGEQEGLVVVELLLDDYPDETRWWIEDALGSIVYMEGEYKLLRESFYYKHASVRRELCLPPGKYSFIIQDSYGDGLAEPGPGDTPFFRITANDHVFVDETGFFGNEQVASFTVEASELASSTNKNGPTASSPSEEPTALLVVGAPPKSTSVSPTTSPTATPSIFTSSPTSSPTSPPTELPTKTPTSLPTTSPTTSPTVSTEAPTVAPTARPPTLSPTPGPMLLTEPPSTTPTTLPTSKPTEGPTAQPTESPTGKPTWLPTEPPTVSPTTLPTALPTEGPTAQPTESPTEKPTWPPTEPPSTAPTTLPTAKRTEDPTAQPTESPTEKPTWLPTVPPTVSPTTSPMASPSAMPSGGPTFQPTALPTGTPTWLPTEPAMVSPMTSPMASPTAMPSEGPTFQPTALPTETPTWLPTTSPMASPTTGPSEGPTLQPTPLPTEKPTWLPTEPPTVSPTTSPLASPTATPSEGPTLQPTPLPTKKPMFLPTEPPTTSPTAGPTEGPTFQPSASPTEKPSKSPTVSPSFPPTALPTAKPSKGPTFQPTSSPTGKPTTSPTELPSLIPTTPPTEKPSKGPTFQPTSSPTGMPTEPPSFPPTMPLTEKPSIDPTVQPTLSPTGVPTELPSLPPTTPPTEKPSEGPTVLPTAAPSGKPTESPTEPPSFPPTTSPTAKPSEGPTVPPTAAPSGRPTESPTKPPSFPPTTSPTPRPSEGPTVPPTAPPSGKPTESPTEPPSFPPTTSPTPRPSKGPTVPPTAADVFVSPNNKSFARYHIGDAKGQDSINSGTLQKDGKILVAGSVYKNSGYLASLTRFLQDGRLDTSFGVDGTVFLDVSSSSDIFYDVAVMNDGRIVASGYAYGDVLVARFLETDGSLDPTFGNGGTVVVSAAAYGTAIEVLPNNDILVCGYGLSSRGDFFLIKLDSRGNLVHNFGTNRGVTRIDVGGNGGTDRARDMMVQPNDGKIVLVGQVWTGSSWDFGVVRYHTNGTPDSSFGSNGNGIVLIDISGNDLSQDYATRVALQDDGKIVIAGKSAAESGGGSDRFALARLDPNGMLDATFGKDGSGIVVTDLGTGNDQATGLAILPNNKILVAGTENYMTGRSNLALLRYQQDGTLDEEHIEWTYTRDQMSDLLVRPTDNNIGNDIVMLGYRSGDHLVAQYTLGK